MAEQTAISWCDHTYNPWTGCAKVSDGCKFCYAENQAQRFSSMFGQWGDQAPRKRASETYLRQPLKWNRQAGSDGVRRRVFCASMADVFEDRKKLYPWRARLFQTIWQTENLDWLLLTKRPENIARLIEQAGEYYVCRDGVIRDISREIIAWGFGGYLPSNIWLGASIENMQTAKERIHHLVAATAPVKFLSCEPLLDWLDLSFWLFKCRECQQRFDYSAGFSLFTQESGQGECSLDMHEIIPAPLLDWIIIGGESGLHARPFNLDYALALLTQCQQAGVPVFVKQMGAVPVISANAWKALDNKPALKARIHYNIPAGYLALKFNDPKGADPAEWPAEFRIQQFPQPKAWKDMPGIIGT